jgi:hypothetical protein
MKLQTDEHSVSGALVELQKKKMRTTVFHVCLSVHLLARISSYQTDRFEIWYW